MAYKRGSELIAEGAEAVEDIYIEAKQLSQNNLTI
jgi:hypothetical protein